MNDLEMDFIDLLQPIGNMMSLESSLKQLHELEINYEDMINNNSSLVKPLL